MSVATSALKDDGGAKSGLLPPFSGQRGFRWSWCFAGVWKEGDQLMGRLGSDGGEGCFATLGVGTWPRDVRSGGNRFVVLA